MHEFLESEEVSSELRRQNVITVLDTIQRLIDSDPRRRISADSSLKDYGLPADMPQEDKNRFESQYRTILDMLQSNWWESRQDPNKMPEIASIKIDVSQPTDAVHRNAFYTSVSATSIDGNVSRFATSSWMDEDGMVKIYDLFLDENGHTSATYNIDFPDDGLYQRLSGLLSDKKSRTLLEYVYRGGIPPDALDYVLEHIRKSLRKSLDDTEADNYLVQLKSHSLDAHEAINIVKATEPDTEMSNIELLDLHDELKSREI